MKNYGDHALFLAILSLRFEGNTFSRTQLEHSRKNNSFRWYNPRNVHFVLLSQHRCHLLFLCIEEIRVFPIIYLRVFHFVFSSWKFYGFWSWKSCDSIRNLFDYSQNVLEIPKAFTVFLWCLHHWNFDWYWTSQTILFLLQIWVQFCT